MSRMSQSVGMPVDTMRRGRVRLRFELRDLFVCAVLGLFATSCGRGPAKTDSPAGEALAQVGPYEITRADLERRIAQLPEGARTTLDDPERKEVLLNQMIDQKLLRLAAEAEKLDQDPEYQQYLEEVKTQLLSAFYSDKVLVPRAQPDSAEVARYYEEHPEEFRVQARVGARQIVTATQSEAMDVHGLLLAGTPFKSLLRRSIDVQTKNLDGALGIVAMGQPVRGLGVNDAFAAQVLEIPEGEISMPIHTDKGWHVVQVETREPERVRDLEAVRPSLERRLQAQNFKTIGQSLVDSMRAAYKVEVNKEALYGEGLTEHTAKELFDRAQRTEDPRERVAIYEQVVAEYGESELAAKAQFMIGFVYADELGEKDRARIALQQVIERYPDSELVDSARWMLKNMDSPLPPLPAAEPGAGEGAEAGSQTP